MKKKASCNDEKIRTKSFFLLPLRVDVEAREREREREHLDANMRHSMRQSNAHFFERTRPRNSPCASQCAVRLSHLAYFYANGMCDSLPSEANDDQSNIEVDLVEGKSIARRRPRREKSGTRNDRQMIRLIHLSYFVVFILLLALSQLLPSTL